jgi:hypothetical protein
MFILVGFVEWLPAHLIAPAAFAIFSRWQNRLAAPE